MWYPLKTTDRIPSASSCGDIDSTISLYLKSSGMTFAEISRLLSREGGFTGLLGRKCSLHEILEGEDHKTTEIREIFRYSVIKHIGALIAVLGGVDAIAFVCEDPGRYMGFILNISSHIGSLEMACGTKPHPGNGEDGDADIPVYVHSIPYDRKKVMVEMIRTHQHRGGDNMGG
jgi:hypothetical protein